MDEQDWKGIGKMLPKGYVWKMQESRKEHVKGRGIGGMVSGVRNGLMVGQGSEEDSETK